MGMTDKQFEAYQKAQLRLLEDVLDEMEKASITGKAKDLLLRMINDIREQLSRP